MKICYLGVGSNLGDRIKNIKSAVKRIKALKDTKVIKLSKVVETKPVGGPVGQSKYLNAVLKIRTDMPALSLLKNLKKIEKDLGRRKTLRNCPRPIDLDILIYSDSVINRKELKVPHPRMMKRSFVLEPLQDLLLR